MEKRYKNVSEKSRKKREKGLADFQKLISDSADEDLAEQRRRSAEIAQLSQKYFFG